MAFLARENWKPFRPIEDLFFVQWQLVKAHLVTLGKCGQQYNATWLCRNPSSYFSLFALRGWNTDERNHLAFHRGTCMRKICGIYTEALPTGFVSTQYLLIASNCLKLHHHTATQQRKRSSTQSSASQNAFLFLFLSSVLFQRKYACPRPATFKYLHMKMKFALHI